MSRASLRWAGSGPKSSPPLARVLGDHQESPGHHLLGSSVSTSVKEGAHLSRLERRGRGPPQASPPDACLRPRL